jgi:hypothetical protein
MSHPAEALKAAIAQHLQANAPVMALLRQPKVHTEPPRAEAYPHVVLETGATRDAGSGTEDGHATELLLRIVTRHTGTAEAHAIAEAVEAALRTLPAALSGHRLINLVHQGTEARTGKTGLATATMRWRAVTEVV